jgi:hypothetical protein
MKSLHHIEQRIFEVDGIRAELSGPVSGHADYWTNKFNGDKRVTEFKSRFAQRYPNVSIVLYDGVGRDAHGGYLLKNLRATYEFSWIQDTVHLYDLLVRQQQEQIKSLKKASGQSAGAGEATPAEPDPYEVLGVASDCSDEEIVQAYKRRITRFHPDKLSGLDEAIIAFGNERAQLINRARDQILLARGKGNKSKAA